MDTTRAVPDLGDTEPNLIDFRDPSRARPALEDLGRLVWKAALDYVYGEATRRPVGPWTYPELRERLLGDHPTKPPTTGAPLGDVLAAFTKDIAPHLYNPIHARSFSYFTPPPIPVAVAADTLASWVNQSVDVFHAAPGAALIEEEVTRWLCDFVGYGDVAWGVLTSGGNMANLMAMALIRERIHHDAGRHHADARVYVSDQVHFSIARALWLIGMPTSTLRVVATDDRFTLPPASLEAAIESDRSEGLHPVAVVGVAGTTNTGSVDDLAGLADVSARHGLWLHVDAAYGGAACHSHHAAQLLRGLGRADSVTLDPHKWMYQPIDVGALLVRERSALEGVFRASPEYYRSNQPSDEPLHWYEWSIEGTRRFRGLKLWMTWKHMGTEGLTALVDRTIERANELHESLTDADDFETAVDHPDLSVICFRHVPAGVPLDALDRYQTALQRALEVSGDAWVSTTVLRGQVFLRAGVMNHMTTSDDLRALVTALRRLSPAVAASI